MKLMGYEIIERTNDSILTKGDKKIYWWRKGHCKADYHYKCDGYSPDGYYSEGLGDTKDEALESIFSWFKTLDKEGKVMDIDELKYLIKGFDDDLPVVIKDDYGWDNIHSVEVIDDTVCLVTESSDFTSGEARIGAEKSQNIYTYKYGIADKNVIIIIAYNKSTADKMMVAEVGDEDFELVTARSVKEGYVFSGETV